MRANIPDPQRRDRLVLVCPTRTQPRHHRRALDLQPYFKKITAVCFDRGYYKGNTWPGGVEEVVLPEIKDRQYGRRIMLFPNALRRLKEVIRPSQEPQVIYAFSVDCAILALLAKRSGDKVIWECGDAVTPFLKNPIRRFLVRAAERWVLKRVDKLVNVCQGMYEEYFYKLDPTSRPKLIVVENRLPDTFKSTAGPTKTGASKPVRIGWIGYLRGGELHEKMLMAAAEDGGRRVSIEIWGDGPSAPLANEYASKYSNITMHGAYREEPEFLRKVYESADMVILLADSTNMNVRYSVPNRLSHCIVYQTPFIVTKGMDMEKRVKDLGIGTAVSEIDEDWSKFFDLLADGKTVNGWIENLKSVPSELGFLDSRELVSVVKSWAIGDK